MRLPVHPVDRKSLSSSARHLFEALCDRFATRVVEIEGGFLIPSSGSLEEYVESWADQLSRAPAKLLEPRTLRAIVDGALGESMMKARLLSFQVGEERATRILREFPAAVDRDRFIDPCGKAPNVWSEQTLRLPFPPEGVPTPSDTELAKHVGEMTREQRATTTKLDLLLSRGLRDLAPLRELTALRELVLCTDVLQDAAPLAALGNLEELSLDAASLSDLSSLSGLTRLRKLYVAARLPDLSWLSGAQALEELEIQRCSLPLDIDVLASLPRLRVLGLSTDGVRDLSPLARMAALRELRLDGRQPVDLSSVAGLTQLTHLAIHHIPIQSLEACRRLVALRKLEALHCDALDDVSAIAGLANLEELDLSCSSMRDLSAVAGLAKLRVIKGGVTDLDALPALASLPCLEELDLGSGRVKTIEGMQDGRALRVLAFGCETLRDLTPLSGLERLEDLSIEDGFGTRGLTPLTDLRPLAALRRLTSLEIDSASVRDLSPLSGLTALGSLALPRTRIVSVEALAGLPELRHLTVTQCYELTSLRPLAACPKLQEIECEDCDLLKGPTTVAQLRAAPPPTVAKTYPSAGLAPARAGTLAVMDLRGHLPRMPPEGWSMPHMSRDLERVCSIDAEGVMLQVSLDSPDHNPRLLVQIAPRNHERASDKVVGRLLRRFRSCEPFVEITQSYEKYEWYVPEDLPFIRAFVARAHPADAASWAPVRERGPMLTVEPSEGDAPDAPDAQAAAAMDVDRHLPSPAPEGWRVEEPRGADDVIRIIETAAGKIVVLLSRGEDSDMVNLAVGMFPPADAPYVTDERARSVLRAFRRSGTFVENNHSPLARAPGMRVFVAPTHR